MTEVTKCQQFCLSKVRCTFFNSLLSLFPHFHFFISRFLVHTFRVTPFCAESGVKRNCISSHCLKQLHPNCTFFFTGHAVCVHNPIQNQKLPFDKMIKQNEASNNAEWKRLHLSGDLTKNFNLYIYIIAMQGIICQVWLSLATVLLSPLLGVTARNNDKLYGTAVYS